MQSRILTILLTLIAILSVQSLAFYVPHLFKLNISYIIACNDYDTICIGCLTNGNPNSCDGDSEDNRDSTSISYDISSKGSLIARSPEDLSPARISCENRGKIKKAKPKFKGCDPANSKGFTSSHNCQGKSYLCVLHNVGTCCTGGSLAKLNAENGECFL